jgi:hypothetical protein
MKRFASLAFALVLFGGCRGTPFLIANFEEDYRPKVKTIVLLPFEIRPENQLAKKHRQELEENLTLWIARGDSLHSFVLPAGVRLNFKAAGLSDGQILTLPADSLGKLFLAEALLFTKVIRLYESEGANQTTREIGASKYLRRGVELLVEFRLVEAASGILLWKHEVRRFGADVPEAIQQVGQAAAENWPLKK